MFGKKEEKFVYPYRGNVCPPPHAAATATELKESAEQFTDIMDTVMELLERASKLMKEPVEDAINNKRSTTLGWFPRFPGCGQKVESELYYAKASIIEASKMVAVQGYSAQRRLKNND